MVNKLNLSNNKRVIRLSQLTTVFVGMTLVSLGFGCPITKTNLNYCSNINGNLFCESRHDDGRIYCMWGSDICMDLLPPELKDDRSFDGCVAEPPVDECYSPCGGGPEQEEAGICALGGTGASTGEMTSGGLASGDDISEDSSTGLQPICGDGIIEGNETCDGTNLNGETCPSLKFDSGELLCGSGCSFDISGCVHFNCGNDEIDGDEICDGADLGGVSCVSLGHVGGDLACANNCGAYETSGCCGDGVIGGKEECDGSDVGMQACSDVDIGYSGGDLLCAEDCTLDTSGCCGDGTIGNGEWCDEFVPIGLSCASLGFLGGALTCNEVCELDTSECFHAVCGNENLDPGELCDGNELGMVSCETLGFHSGMLTCNDDCGGYNTEGCAICGNGVREGNEMCDGDDLGGATCNALDMNEGGVLGCDEHCLYNENGCAQYSGDCCDALANNTPGCENPICTTVICALEPSCCIDVWDAACEGFAETEAMGCECPAGGM